MRTLKKVVKVACLIALVILIVTRSKEAAIAAIVFAGFAIGLEIGEWRK